MKKSRPKASLSAFLILLGLLISLSINSISHSGRKAFWRDEAYSFEHSISNGGLVETIVKGAKSQGSPSPLDYVFLKSTYHLRSPLKYLYLQPHQYMRIHYLLAIWLVLFYLFFKVKKVGDIKNTILFSLSSGIFLLNSTIYYYSSEMRPYSLWATLSLLFLFLISRRSSSKTGWALATLGLSLTTTASLFQILSFVVAYYLVEITTQKKWFIKLGSDATWGAVLLGVLINLYYINRIPLSSWGQSPTWEVFFKFWTPFVPVIMTGLLLTWHHLKTKQKGKAMASLTAAGWLLFGPISFLLTLKKGFFLDPRQYVYYHPVFFLYGFQLASIFFTKVKKISLSRTLVIFSIIPFSLSLISHLNLSLPAQAIRTIILGDPVSIPVNHQKISPLIPNNIPAKTEFIPIDQYRLTNKAAQTNLKLWWDYLNVIYPQDKYPRDNLKTLVVRARGYNIELTDIIPVP